VTEPAPPTHLHRPARDRPWPRRGDGSIVQE
jgi:hypothetical protein